VVLVADECRIEKEAGTGAVWFPRGETITIKVDQQKQAVSFYGALNVESGSWQVKIEGIEKGLG
jgi:hypothetical protein